MNKLNSKKKRGRFLIIKNDLPTGWKRLKLGEIGKFLKGKGLPKEHLASSGLPCIRYGEIYTTYDTVAKKLSSFVPKSLAKHSQPIQHNDIVFAGSGETREDIAKAVAYLGREVAYAGGDVIILRPEKKVDAAFLSHYLSTNEANHQKFKLAEGYSVVHIYPEELATIEVLLPPLPEQKRISRLFGHWEEAIGKLGALITQKELRRKALMQQLLTGKKRLRGFRGAWSRHTIGEIAEEVTTPNSDGEDLVVLSSTKHQGLVPSLEYFGRRIFSQDLSAYKVVPQNCFAYATNHIEEGSIGYQSKYKRALISPMYTVFRTTGRISNEFLFLLLKSHELIHQYRKRTEGSINRRGGLRWSEFSKIPIKLPSKQEQDAIEKVLRSAQTEIDLLSKKLEMLKEQKKGLMQKLLTGQIRVNKVR